MGIVNIATTSVGHRACGGRLNRYRRRQARLRQKLQAKKSRSARRLLRKRSRKEARFAADINHQISRRIWPRLNPPGKVSPLNDLRGSANGYGFASPNGPRCIHGRSLNLARSSHTRRDKPGWRSSKSTLPTRRRHAAHAAGWINETAALRLFSHVSGVASLGTPTTMQRSTLPLAVSIVGAKSCAHTLRPP